MICIVKVRWNILTNDIFCIECVLRFDIMHSNECKQCKQEFDCEWIFDNVIVKIQIEEI